MRVNKIYISFLVVLVVILFANKVQACSMYKITVDGKTIVGCNEDAWRTTSKIWFENARNSNEYGAGFTGSRPVGLRMAPQSGMNEVGLTFSRLEAYYPNQDNMFQDRKRITDEVVYLTDIMHTCATIKEVKAYISQYDHSLFYDHVFIYIDSTGKYLIVEPYKLIEGDNPNYVLSNFCPSITHNDQARNLERYRNGEDFLKTHKVDSLLPFCKSLSDTMHVSRSRNGDGTLLTSIWDTKDKLVNLYFYHSYDTTVQFDLVEELGKGDHIINIPTLFPANPQFERLASYKTPFNTVELRFLLVFLAGFLMLFSFIFWVYSVWSKNRMISFKTIALISLLNVLLVCYLFVLATDKYIYYFDAPYKHYSSDLISASSYIPFVLALCIIPFTLFTIKHLKLNQIHGGVKTILTANNLIYIMLFAGFVYWGLYDVLS